MQRIVIFSSILIIIILFIVFLIIFTFNEEKKEKLEEDFEHIDFSKEKYYIPNNLERYIIYYDQNKNKTFSDIVREINCNLDYEFYNGQERTNTLDKTLMIVNKHYILDNDFEGFDLIKVNNKYAYYDKEYYMNKEAYENFEKMWQDAYLAGCDFGIYSAYRSFVRQEYLYNSYVKMDGAEKADTYSARAGSSEHQTGLAVDLKSRTKKTDYFETTREYDWLSKNSYKYGFILRYKEDTEYLTGYQFEPWHYRYCGVECAAYIYENNITYEEYYEYFIKNKSLS